MRKSGQKVREELTNQIYDTLFGNVGMSEHHKAFEKDKAKEQMVQASSGKIIFNFDGKAVYIKIFVL